MWDRASRRVIRHWRGRRGQPLTPDTPVIVITDLDGSFQAHGARADWPRADTLARLTDANIPLIISSSGTRAEIEHLQLELGLRHPFISENGGALFVPLGAFPGMDAPPAVGSVYQRFEFGGRYHEVVDALRRTASELAIPIVGFDDMSVEDVAQDCHITLSAARLAKLRQYSEVFRVVHWSPSLQSHLFSGLHRRRVRCFSRGRYHHVTSVADPGSSVRTLSAMYRKAWGQVVTVGIVDGLGDLALLREVDVPIVVHNPPLDAATLIRKVPTARLTRASGSDGWNEAIADLLELTGN